MSGILEALGIRPANVDLLADRNVPLDAPMPYDPSHQVPGSDPAVRVGDVAGGLLQATPGAGDAYSVLQAIKDFEEERYASSVLNALGALPMVAGTFGGVRAKTADLMQLERANKMLSEGVDPAAIWKETGWTNQFPDGKWRFEIDDSGSQLVNVPRGQSLEQFSQAAEAEKYGRRGPNVSQLSAKEFKTHLKWLDQVKEEYNRTNETNRPLSGILEHPEVAAAYPELYDQTKVFWNPSLGTKGAYDNGVISFGDTSNQSSLRGLIGGHELMHGIQGVEGFARGGSPDMAFRDKRMWGAKGAEGSDVAVKMLKERLKKLQTPMSLEDYAKSAWQSDKVTDEIAQDYKKNYLPVMKNAALRPELVNAAQRDVALDWYHNLAGEAEARLVQKRMDYSREKRRDIPPWLEFDVPIDQQIVRYGVANGKPVSSVLETLPIE